MGCLRAFEIRRRAIKWVAVNTILILPLTLRGQDVKPTVPGVSSEVLLTDTVRQQLAAPPTSSTKRERPGRSLVLTALVCLATGLSVILLYNVRSK